MAGEDRPAVSDGSRDPSASGGRRASVGDARAAVEAVWRTESARIVGALARLTRDFPLAEDLAQQALAEALVSWPRKGVPTNPAGWLLTVGRRRAIDVFRRRSVGDARHATLAREVALAAEEGEEEADVLADPDRIDDDVLALLFIACHPSLGRDAQVALTLRVVGGLSSDEIARAFLVPTATVQARITRAKKALGAAGVPFAVGGGLGLSLIGLTEPDGDAYYASGAAVGGALLAGALIAGLVLLLADDDAAFAVTPLPDAPAHLYSPEWR